jgi:hypothetical protein
MRHGEAALPPHPRPVAAVQDLEYALSAGLVVVVHHELLRIFANSVAAVNDRFSKLILSRVTTSLSTGCCGAARHLTVSTGDRQLWYKRACLPRIARSSHMK